MMIKNIKYSQKLETMLKNSGWRLYFSSVLGRNSIDLYLYKKEYGIYHGSPNIPVIYKSITWFILNGIVS